METLGITSKYMDAINERNMPVRTIMDSRREEETSLAGVIFLILILLLKRANFSPIATWMMILNVSKRSNLM